MGRRGVTVRLKHLWTDRDRHGNQRFYVAVPGRPKVRLRAVFGTDAFMAAYAAAVAAPPEPIAKVDPRALDWLVQRYLQSLDFKRRLKPATQAWRRRLLENLCASGTPGGTRRGALPFALIEPKHIRALIAERAGTPHEADKLLKSLRRLYAFALEMDYVKVNPALAVRYLRERIKGHHTWTIGELERYKAQHPLGTKAHLALGLLLYTGQRRSDVVCMGPQHRSSDELSVTQQKTGKRLVLPILPDLSRILDATPCGHLSFLVTGQGQPFTGNGFGNKFRTWCDEAGLPHCSAHGLRKAGATIAAENGATSFQLMAIFGFAIDEAEVYVRAANQRHLARAAMAKILPLTSSGESKTNKDLDAPTTRKPPIESQGILSRETPTFVTAEKDR